MTGRHPHVVALDALDWVEPFAGAPAGFGGAMKRLGPAAGMRALGASLFRVPAGRTMFPHHAHHGMEEAVFVLEGRGIARVDGARVAVGRGDWLAFPRGTAHQLLADRGDELVYVCVSDQADPEVCTYPDTGKVAAFAGGWPPSIRVMVKDGAAAGYWDGEPAPGDAGGEILDGHARLARGEATPWDALAHPAPFGGSRQRLGRAAGSVRLGASRYRVPAGAAAFPRHAHLGNEEAILVLSGEGTLRLGDATVDVRAHDVVALPAGEGLAHQLRAVTDLDYLVVSTMIWPEVCVYPDSGKLGVFARPPGGSGEGRFGYVRDEAVGYWDGEV